MIYNKLLARAFAHDKAEYGDKHKKKAEITTEATRNKQKNIEKKRVSEREKERRQQHRRNEEETEEQMAGEHHQVMNNITRVNDPKKEVCMNRITMLWLMGFVVSVMIIVYLTLSPGVVKKGINLVPFKDNMVFVKAFCGYGKMGRQALPQWVYLNLFGNVVLFMPFGFFLTGFLASSSSRVSSRVVVLSGGVLSVGIEVVQLFIPTRATDIDDVIFNTVSTCFGVIVFFMMNILYQRLQRLLSVEGSHDCPHVLLYEGQDEEKDVSRFS